MKKAIILFFFYMLSLYHPVSAATIAITADKDTYIDKVYPDVNFGQKWNMLVSGAATKPANGLVHFNFSTLPANAIVQDATLTFLVHANHSTAKYFIHPLSTFWQEDTATWNLAETGISWGTPGGDYDPALFCETTLPGTTPQWMVTDVTSVVSDQQGYLRQGIADKGLLIRGDAGYNKILSSEFSTYANALTCHSCHGTNDPSLDVGKSTNCAQCHSQGEIRLSGEPKLNITYQPMLFQFVQVSDTHIGKSSQQATNLSNAVAQINTINPAFVLFSGDLTDSGTLEQYSVFKTAVANLSMPYHCVPGDNDVVDGEGDLQRYREQLGDDYYTFDYQGFQFIGLNNNVDLALDQTQRQWLENELKDGKPGIIFAHRPLLNYQDGTPFPEAEPLLNLIDAYTVNLFMNGHDHRVQELIRNNTAYIWCKNLSYAHMGDPYNLYRIYADRILLYHVDLRDGSETFVGSYPVTQPDSDQDGIPDTDDNCPTRPNGSALGTCSATSDKPGINCNTDTDCANGCSSNGLCIKDQRDADNDGAGDVCDCAPLDETKFKIWTVYVDADGDGHGAGTAVNVCGGATMPAGYSTSNDDGCPDDPLKIAPGICGCGVPDTDNDGDGVLNCNDNCPNTPNGPLLGTCMPGSDKAGATCYSDADCVNGCTSNGKCSLNQEDTNKDGIGDVCS